jgi:DNA invertase Pin-like site-specific DNA recombinase
MQRFKTMAYPSKFKQLEAETGEPAAAIVLRTLNQSPSITQAARELNVSGAALLKFIDKEKLSKATVWVKAG